MTAHNMRFLMNSTAARMRSALASVLGGSDKHDHYKDFGWPDDISFDMLKHMWGRNPLARAAVEVHIEKVWESDPELFEAEEAHDPTPLEKAFKVWAGDTRFWQKLAEADRRSMVGDYAAVILQVADGLEWNQPLGRIRGLQDVWDVIPVWQGELKVASWELDQTSRRYGEPLTYQYQEQPRREAENQPPVRQVVIHHSRVLVWSSTGDLNGRSLLRSVYNSLLDVEKVMGGGAEGFWKNARSSLVIDITSDANLDKLAKVLGTTPAELGDKLNEVSDDFSRGFDKALITQGMTVSPVSVSMPQPGEFQDGPLKMVATGVRTPMRVLLGNLTGERASTEDEMAWAKRCNGLRDREKKPLLRAVLNMLEMCGAIPAGVNWYIEWGDLTEGSLAEKLTNAALMADINTKMVGTGEMVPFSGNEIREAAGYDAEDEPEFDEGAPPIVPVPGPPDPGAGLQESGPAAE